MHEWEYSKVDLNDLPRKTEDIDLLNDAGAQGWEIITITPNMIAYLKRQIERPGECSNLATLRRGRTRLTLVGTSRLRCYFGALVRERTTPRCSFVHEARQTTYGEAPAAIAMLYPQLAQGEVYQIRCPR